MTLIAVVGTVAVFGALWIVIDRMDRDRSDRFRETQADIVTKAGNTASGDGTGFGAL